MADVVAAARYLNRELTQYDQTFYQTVHPRYWAANGELHPTVGDLSLGTKRIVAEEIDTVGDAKIYDGQADDVPFADFGITESEFKARVIISGAKWNLFDIEAQMVANRNSTGPQTNLVETKMLAVSQAIDKRLHELACFGDTKQGMQGIFTGDRVDVLDEAQDLYGLSTDDLYTYFVDLCGQFEDDSLLTAQVVDVLMPKRLMTRLQLRFPQNSDGTPYRLLLENNVIARMIPVNELRSDILEKYGVFAPGTDTDRMMIGNMADMMALKRQFYGTQRTTPRVHPNGLKFQMTAYAATSEAQFRQPFKFRYINFAAPTP